MAVMQNQWVSSGDQFAAWRAELSDLTGRPDELRAWLRRVLDAGESYEVYRVVEAPLAAYRRDRDGSFTAFLERQFEERGVLDVFGFAESGMRVVDGSRLGIEATLAHYTPEGDLVEEPVRNLGELLRQVRPEAVEESPGLMVGSPPLDVWGGKRLDFGHTNEPEGALATDRIRLSFSIRSDIWFPWVAGFIADAWDPNGMYDNRPLAERHTPRFNEFLREVREATLSFGGEWTILEETSYPSYEFMTDEREIRLESSLPNGVRSMS